MFLICFFLVGFSPNAMIFFILMMIVGFAASLTRGPLMAFRKIEDKYYVPTSVEVD
jgi:hypothetical protein